MRDEVPDRLDRTCLAVEMNLPRLEPGRLRRPGGSPRVDAMLLSTRCGAKTRTGDFCRSPAVSGRMRCRMHGGAGGSGAPAGNKNALKTGLHTAEVRELRRAVRTLIREAYETLGN